jgi:hypothetical protein
VPAANPKKPNENNLPFRMMNRREIKIGAAGNLALKSRPHIACGTANPKKPNENNLPFLSCILARLQRCYRDSENSWRSHGRTRIIFRLISINERHSKSSLAI